ncbi:MAG: hypothetical protein WBA88_08160 [Pseudaminobacter sp.]|jgi:hypothetical protein
MTRPLKAALVLAASIMAIGSNAHAQSAPQFPDVSESVPELIDLYTQSDSGCRLTRGNGDEVQVACTARSFYGAVLNERGWCLGKEGQANAEMEWHECEAASMRFPPIDLPEL